MAILAVAGTSAYRWADDRSSIPKGADGVIERVTDGDTVRVRMSSGSESVRLIGIDTPETVDRNRPVGCYGKEASDFTKKTLPQGTGVKLVLDAEPRDRYGRLLAYVYRSSDDLFVNAELAKQGYAQQLTIPPNVAHESEFRSWVEEARNDKRGLWGKCPEAK